MSVRKEGPDSLQSATWLTPTGEYSPYSGMRNSRKAAYYSAIDGAQAAGHVPVDLGTLDVDFYFFSGHQWCAAPMGTGALLMAKQYKERHARRESGLLVTGGAQEYVDLGT